jgi:zinc-binding in reverse transcriptase
VIHIEPTSIWSEKLRPRLGIQSIENLVNITHASTSYFIRDLQSLEPLFSSCTLAPLTDQPSLWALTQDSCYSSKLAYDFITCPGVKQQLPHIPWKLCIPSKVKIFLWLLHRNRILTNANLRKINWPCSDTCSVPWPSRKTLTIFSSAATMRGEFEMTYYQ